jgi:hypothetical protein
MRYTNMREISAITMDSELSEEGSLAEGWVEALAAFLEEALRWWTSRTSR